MSLVVVEPPWVCRGVLFVASKAWHRAWVIRVRIEQALGRAIRIPTSVGLVGTGYFSTEVWILFLVDEGSAGQGLGALIASKPVASSIEKGPWRVRLRHCSPFQGIDGR